MNLISAWRRAFCAPQPVLPEEEIKKQEIKLTIENNDGSKHYLTTEYISGVSPRDVWPDFYVWYLDSDTEYFIKVHSKGEFLLRRSLIRTFMVEIYDIGR